MPLKVRKRGLNCGFNCYSEVIFLLIVRSGSRGSNSIIIFNISMNNVYYVCSFFKIWRVSIMLCVF